MFRKRDRYRRQPERYALIDYLEVVMVNNGESCILVLKSAGEELVVPITINVFEAQTLFSALRGFVSKPLIVRIVECLGAKVKSAFVTERKGNVYSTVLIFQKRNGKDVQISVNPYEAVFYTRLFGAPIFVSRDLLTNLQEIKISKGKVTVVPVQFHPPFPTGKRHIEDVIAGLQASLEDAVAQENFIEAARFRDALSAARAELVQKE